MDILIVLFAKYPGVIGFLTTVGALRIINKPLFSILRMYTKITPDKSDDKAIDYVEKSKVYQTITYILDYLGSVKVDKK